jgi:hypothetical protein
MPVTSACLGALLTVLRTDFEVLAAGLTPISSVTGTSATSEMAYRTRLAADENKQAVANGAIKNTLKYHDARGYLNSRREWVSVCR